MSADKGVRTEGLSADTGLHVRGGVSRDQSFRYRDFHIYYDPPPIPVRSCDWHYYHDDYDGAPDAYDKRHGNCPSEAACRAEIDEWYADQACLSPDEMKAQAARCSCRGHDEWCGCQNVADAATIAVRLAKATGGQP